MSEDVPRRLEKNREYRSAGLPDTVPEPRCGDMISFRDRDELAELGLEAGVYRVGTTSRRSDGKGANYGLWKVDGEGAANLSGEELAGLWETDKSALWPTVYPEVDLMHRRRDVENGGITWHGEPLYAGKKRAERRERAERYMQVVNGEEVES